jgi:hypothetical protein
MIFSLGAMGLCILLRLSLPWRGHAILGWLAFVDEQAITS